LHQSVWHGEHPSHGHDPEHGVVPIRKNAERRTKKSRLRYKRWRIAFLAAMLVTLVISAVVAPSAKPGNEARVWIILLVGSILFFGGTLLFGTPSYRRSRNSRKRG
jgi:O-antigen/teichoic acid export membrane protein